MRTTAIVLTLFLWGCQNNESKDQMLNIDGADFGLSDECEITINDDGTLYMELEGDEDITDSLSEGDPSWDWILYPPKFYIYDLPVGQGEHWEKDINLGLLDKYEIGLYLMNHSDVTGTLSRSGSAIEFIGTVDLMGETKRLHIRSNIQ